MGSARVRGVTATAPKGVLRARTRTGVVTRADPRDDTTHSTQPPPSPPNPPIPIPIAHARMSESGSAQLSGGQLLNYGNFPPPLARRNVGIRTPRATCPATAIPAQPSTIHPNARKSVSGSSSAAEQYPIVAASPRRRCAAHSQLAPRTPRGGSGHGGGGAHLLEVALKRLEGLRLEPELVHVFLRFLHPSPESRQNNHSHHVERMTFSGGGRYSYNGLEHSATKRLRAYSMA